MKMRPLSRWPAGLLSMIVLPALFAVDEPAASAKDSTMPAAAVPDSDGLVPFRPEPSEAGYPAAGTLGCGGCGRVDLKDIAADISVVTEEFLRSTSASSANDLLCYTNASNPELGGAPAGGGGLAVQGVPGPACSTAAVDRPRMEVVFVLDTTGSMGSMIASAKRKIWAIASKLKAAQPTPEIHFGLIGYRDHGDEYVTKLYPLSGDIDSTYEHLNAFAASGGGDTPEAVNEALTCALHEIRWSADSHVLRAIFLVGDAPPHMDYPKDVKWQDSCREAKTRGILINTLQCGIDSDTAHVWRKASTLAAGAYTAMQDAGRTTAIATPFDGDIIGINHALNETIVPYGSRAEQDCAGRNGALLEALSAEGIADRSAFLNRTEAGAVMSGKGDLIVELLTGRMTLAQVDPVLLDSSLERLPAAERDALIGRKLERRRELQKSLAKLLAQREAAVAAQLKAAEGSDEMTILSPFQVLTEQAEAKGYSFK